MNIFEINQAIIDAAIPSYGVETEQDNGALDVVYLAGYEVQLMGDMIFLNDSYTGNDIAEFADIESLIAHLKNVIKL